MRLKQLSYAAAIMSLGTLMAACSSESLVPEPDAPVDKDTDFYINVKIATPAETETRANDNVTASDYVNGTEEEQKINEIFFVFYNSDHQYVGNSTYTPKSEELESQNKDGSIETILNITVPVTVAKGSTKPAFVMAYINPTVKAKNDLLNNYYEALGAFRELYEVVPKGTVPAPTGSKQHEGFSMNNSVHYEEEAADELPTIAVPLTKGLYTSKEAAQAEDAESVVIYVERIVAKVALDESKSADGTPNWTQSHEVVQDEDENVYTFTFEVLGWGLSNLENYTFLVKNFRTEDDGNPTTFNGLMSFTNYQYGELNTRLATNGGMTSPNWNFKGGLTGSSTDNWAISGHRSFWALSPTYYHTSGEASSTVQIPTYADDIYKPAETTDASALAMPNPSLIYRSFNDIYNTKPATPVKGAYGQNIGGTQYTLEHTMQASMITDYQKRAVTCAIVVGRYKLQKGTGAVAYPTDNFYLRKIMTADGIKSIIYPSDKEMKQAYLAKNTTIYIANPEYTEGGEAPQYIPVPYSDPESGTNTHLGDFVIDHARKDITGTSIPSRYVTLKLQNTEGYYYQDATGAFKAVTSTNLGQVNKDLYNNMIGMLGGIEMYKSGYAYFEVPVKHLWGRGAGDKSIGDENFVAKLGQYGIVRNHCYNIKINGIEGLGTGISDPDAPIVPNIDNDNYLVKTEIRVQRWRVVPEQSVTLKP